MKLIERIVHELEERKIMQKDFCATIGISTSTFTGWKVRNVDPPVKYISAICDFFGWNASEVFKTSYPNEPNSKFENSILNSKNRIVVDLTKFDQTSLELVTTFNELSLRDKTRVLNYIFELKNEVGE